MTVSPNSVVAQLLREQCNKAFRDHSIQDVAGALQMLTADVIVSLSGTERTSLIGAEAFSSDIKNIIRERFALAGSKGH